jgi:hypothetical protein
MLADWRSIMIYLSGFVAVIMAKWQAFMTVSRIWRSTIFSRQPRDGRVPFPGFTGR